MSGGQTTPTKTSVNAYHTGLVEYWAGRQQTSIEYITATLAEDPDHPYMLPMYRLWIELLAELNDKSSLRALCKHLIARATMDTSLSVPFMALRGLIHIELDEIEAAKLYQRSLAQYHRNPYCAEFLQKFEVRTESKPQLYLFNNISVIFDFFHWQTLATDLYRDHQEQKLQAVLMSVGKMYPNAPLPHLFEFHRSWDVQAYEDAQHAAARLVNLYPGHADFYLFQGMAALKLKDYHSATEILEMALSLTGHHDLDTVALIGHTFLEIYKETNDPEFKESSLAYLSQAQKLMVEAGMSAYVIEKQIAQLEKHEKSISEGEEKDEFTGRVWLLKLPAMRYHQFKNAHYDQIKEILYPLNHNAEKGDLCLIATELKATEGKDMKPWRIAGLYYIEDDPVWHPLDGMKSPLKLLHRPAQSIGIDIVETDAANEDQSHIFELDDKAIEHISEEISFHANKDDLNIWQQYLPQQAG